MDRLNRHLGHHGRFYLSGLLGLVVYGATAWLRWPLPAAAAGDAFFLAYLATGFVQIARTSNAGLRRRAQIEDEGVLIVVAIALVAIVYTVAGIFGVLNMKHRPETVAVLLTLAGAPLGWCMLHMLSAFHYANLYYFAAAAPPGRGRESALQFPGEAEPGLWDFLYFSLVIGMTAQVSDVVVQTTPMRRAVMGHSVVSFFFNTVLIAMAVNGVVAGVS